MEKLILEYIKKNNLIDENDKILVAVSGGPDSMCLLNVLNNLKDVLKIKLYVAHVNHLVRNDAKADADYVFEFCKNKDIPFFLKECNIIEKSKLEKISVEESGRIARYEFFEEISKKYNINKVAIGHNKNDLVETLIMNLLRGSGTQGLRAIVNKNGNYIRPLLNILRTDIEKYCNCENLEPRIDSTNFENKYTRNKIRNIVIPYIREEFNPNIVETLSRLSEIATDEQAYIDSETEKTYNRIKEFEDVSCISINAKLFLKLDIVIKRKVILYTIKKLFGSTKQIEKKHIEDIILLIDKNIGNKFLMPNKNLKIDINRGIVKFFKL